MKTIDCKGISENNIDIIQQKIFDRNIKPKLAIILASNDVSSKKYVELKMKKASQIGIETEIFSFDSTVTFDMLKQTIHKLNKDNLIHAILIQLPLYEHLKKDRNKILNLIAPQKDVDGLGNYNLGKLIQFEPDTIIPATVTAIMYCINDIYTLPVFNIENYNKNLKFDSSIPNQLEAKKVLIINNSILIGKPLAMILSQYNTTVTIANKFTKNLEDYISKADIIVSATGVGHLIKASDLKDDVVFIDVTSIEKNGEIIGDLEIDNANKNITITSVPGGIGPLTISCLFENLLLCIEKQSKT